MWRKEAISVSMSSRIRIAVRCISSLLLVALVLWGLAAWWIVQRTQSVGESMGQAIRQDWPADSAPPLAMRERLLSTADQWAAWDYVSLGDGFAPPVPPSREDRTAAVEFLGKRPELRIRLLAATKAAQRAEGVGTDVTAARDALARAFRGAVEEDESTMQTQLDLAERMLDGGGTAACGPIDAASIAELVVSIEPAYQLSKDLLTEGGPAAEKVLCLAAHHYRNARYGDASTTLHLAAHLLGTQLSSGGSAGMPDWFTELGEEELPTADARAAAAAVELAEAMVPAMSAHATIVALVEQSRRQLDAGQVDMAAWKAQVALNALGVDDQAIATATASEDAPRKEAAL